MLSFLSVWSFPNPCVPPASRQAEQALNRAGPAPSWCRAGTGQAGISSEISGLCKKSQKVCLTEAKPTIIRNQIFPLERRGSLGEIFEV